MSSEIGPSRPLPSSQGGSPHGSSADAELLSAALYGTYFVATYPPFSQWSPEAVGSFRELLAHPAEVDRTIPLGLYVHVPFCAERCRYCYYLSYDGIGGGYLGRYIDCLGAELRQYARSPILEDRRLDFVYLGGGTPSLLSEAALVRLFAELTEGVPWDEAREVTFECAPKSVTRSKMELLRDAGVTRLSLGVQQLDDAVLARNGRVHLVRDIEAAYEAIRRAGFDVVNLDLMVGMVGESRTSLFESLERAIELEPDSFTVYQMEIPLNTPLYRDLEEGRESASEMADWDEKHRRLAAVFERLASEGYEPISAYALVKDRSRHDFLYQREQYEGADLLGTGASSFGYLQGTHYQNETALDSYLEGVERGDLPLLRAHCLTREERLRREFLLQLKLGVVERREIVRKFGVDPVERFRGALEPLVEAGWLEWDDARIALTPSGLVRVDHLIPRLYPPELRSVRYS